MNYLQHYKSLIRKAQLRNNGCEKHHIFPRAIFGDNDSIVLLTMREHYVAHKLLFHICNKRYGKHPHTYKMALACEMMGNRSSRYYATSRQYFIDNHHTKTKEGRLINSKSKLGSKNGMFGKPAPNRGIPHTDKTKLKNKEAHDKKYKITFATGEERVIIGMKQFAMDNNYNHSHLIQIGKGKRKRHKDVINVIKI